MAGLEPAIQSRMLRRSLFWMGGSSPPMESELGRFCRYVSQRRQTIHIRRILRAMRQGFDMPHHQGRAIQEKESAAGLSIIAPHLSGPVFAYKGRLTERRLQA